MRWRASSMSALAACGLRGYAIRRFSHTFTAFSRSSSSSRSCAISSIASGANGAPGARLTTLSYARRTSVELAKRKNIIVLPSLRIFFAAAYIASTVAE